MFNFLKTRLYFFFMDYLEMWYWIYTSRDISLLTIVDTVLNAWFTRHYVSWFLKVQDEGLIWPHKLRVHSQKDRVVWVNLCTGKKCVETLAHLRSDQRNEKWRSSLFLLSFWGTQLMGWSYTHSGRVLHLSSLETLSKTHPEVCLQKIPSLGKLTYYAIIHHRHIVITNVIIRYLPI